MNIRKALIIAFFSGVVLGGCTAQNEKGQSPMGQLIAKLLPANSESKHKKMMTNLSSPDPDLRREGIVALRTSKIKDVPATREVLTIMAKGDAAPQVRATALESLGHMGVHHEKMPALLDVTLKDNSAMVRRESARILAQRNDPADLDRLLDRLTTDTDVVVRTTVAETLGTFPDRKTLRALIGRLEDDFSEAYQARQSLMKLTGQDFDYDTSRWQNWLSETPDPFAASALPRK